METNRYPLSMRILHWLMAAIAVTMFCIGFYMAGIPDEAPNKHDLYPWHMSFGVLMLLLVCVRLVNRLRSELPVPPATHAAWERKAGRTAHYLMYGLLFLVPVAGYVMVGSYAEGHGIAFFGSTLPDLVPKNESLFEAAHEAHEIGAFALIAVACVHLLAALRHRYIAKDPDADVIKRII